METVATLSDHGQLEVYVTSGYNTSATVTLPVSTVSRTVHVPNTFLLPLYLRSKGSVKSKKGILVESGHDISVHAIDKMEGSVDGFVALPVTALGTTYFAVCHWTASDLCQILIVGTQDSTHVYVQVSCNSSNGHMHYNNRQYSSRDLIVTTVNRLESVQLQCTGDFTGTMITGSRPLAVYSGNRQINGGSDVSKNSHLVEQLFPVTRWGKKFVFTPTNMSNIADVLIVVAGTSNTMINAYCSDQIMTPIELDYPGSFSNFKMSGVCHIVATQPIQMFQIVQGLYGIAASMTTVVPVSGFTTNYLFMFPIFRPNGGECQTRLTYVVDNKSRSGLRLDGHALPINTNVTAVPGTDLVTGRILINCSQTSFNLTHTFTHVDAGARYSATIHGRHPPVSLFFCGVDIASSACRVSVI